jgi:alpha-D-ribose 1-methylphosphonate 5-triphosphate synthase subunit PhnI
MYVAVKGGERAIRNAHALLADVRRGDRATPEIAPAQIDEQLSLAVDRVMSEGSLYDRRIAALAIKQARGDMIEAIFLVRAYRTTLPRFGFTEALDTAAMTLRRRVSATFKDLPGGQVLGPTFDYMHRLIDFDLDAPGAPESADSSRRSPGARAPRDGHHRARRPDRSRDRPSGSFGRRHHARCARVSRDSRRTVAKSGARRRRIFARETVCRWRPSQSWRPRQAIASHSGCQSRRFCRR